MRLRISPRSTALASALSVLLLSSCALAGTPKWVRKGRVDCTLAPCPGVYSAVGHVKGVKNAQLRRSTADANARAELAKVISRKLKKAPSKEFQSLVIESTYAKDVGLVSLQTVLVEGTAPPIPQIELELVSYKLAP